MIIFAGLTTVFIRRTVCQCYRRWWFICSASTAAEYFR